MRRVAALATTVVALDQATKAWAVEALADGPIEVIGSFAQFRLTRNPGSAFSLFAGSGAVLAVVAVVLIVVLVRMARRESDSWVVTGLALVLGGALGNLLDRLFRGDGLADGHVVDFVDIGRWPTFNVADAAITIGVAVVLLRAWRSPAHEPVDG